MIKNNFVAWFDVGLAVSMAGIIYSRVKNECLILRLVWLGAYFCFLATMHASQLAVGKC